MRLFDARGEPAAGNALKPIRVVKVQLSDYHGDPLFRISRHASVRKLTTILMENQLCISI